jgi:hypothetical protein
MKQMNVVKVWLAFKEVGTVVCSFSVGKLRL